jgi:predicted regulator of Ras-like GTPase activity (Roadblock/LC7/MglB family)
VNFEESISALLQECPGASAVAIIDPDGIPVASVPADGDVEEVGAELAAVLREVSQSERELQHGQLRQFTIQADEAEVVVTPLGGGYFLLVILGRDGLAGKARFLSRLTGTRIHSEFI